MLEMHAWPVRQYAVQCTSTRIARQRRLFDAINRQKLCHEKDPDSRHGRSDAHARHCGPPRRACRGASRPYCRWNFGGLAVGALIGAAAANGPYYYVPSAVYYYGLRCYWTRAHY
jgi:hypothetical protein